MIQYSLILVPAVYLQALLAIYVYLLCVNSLYVDGRLRPLLRATCCCACTNTITTTTYTTTTAWHCLYDTCLHDAALVYTWYILHPDNTVYDTHIHTYYEYT